MTTTSPAIVTAVTVGNTAPGAAAVTAKPRDMLGIYNQSTTATVYIGFDAAPTAAATAGQLSLLPVAGNNVSFIVWNGEFTPANAIWLIASAGATPCTIIEG